MHRSPYHLEIYIRKGLTMYMFFLQFSYVDQKGVLSSSCINYDQSIVEFSTFQGVQKFIFVFGPNFVEPEGTRTPPTRLTASPINGSRTTLLHQIELMQKFWKNIEMVHYRNWRPTWGLEDLILFSQDFNLLALEKPPKFKQQISCKILTNLSCNY